MKMKMIRTLSVPPRQLLLLYVSMCASAAVSILPGHPLNCSRQDLACTVTTSNCMDSGWLDMHLYTPSSPEDLQVSVDIRQDDTGHLQPVLLIQWKLRDDGGINFVNATEVHVLVLSTNQNLCVRYSFKDKLKMRNGLEKWSFSANMLVVDPGQTYRVSVFNIPKPEQGHSTYDVSTHVTVPDCDDPRMRRTQFCVERGSLWQPNISVTQNISVSGRPVLAVSFSPDPLCEEYIVIISCSNTQRVNSIYKANQTTLNVNFNLDEWPRSCCQLDVEIKPVFPQCGQDCEREKKTLDICPVKPTDAPDVPVFAFYIPGVVLMCVVIAVIIYFIYRKPEKNSFAGEGKVNPMQKELKHRPKVLVIYSHDHHLYRDIVLRLCAFLQSKCGIHVLMDLLDTTSVGMVGGPRWLQWQRQQLTNPADKILVLCSRGVQAKWRAMCGQGQVMLREDILSPNDDMLTPFLNLFITEIHQPANQAKYIVAYFDDISSEQDVPSAFDLGVKYKLMKHFEELCFRILDIEKYQPRQVRHIEGIGGDEYFKSDEGRALKNAIEIFQAYQVENPDWFERECVDSEEDVLAEVSPLTEQLQIPPVLECVPLVRDGHPVFIQDVQIHESGRSIHVLMPELHKESKMSSVTELKPVVKPEYRHQYLSNRDEVWTDHLYPYSPSECIYTVEPDLNKPPQARQGWISLQQDASGHITSEDEEEDSLLPVSNLSPSLYQRGSDLLKSMSSSLFQPESPCANIQRVYLPSSEISHSEPVEMEEYEDIEPRAKGQSSGSDQGYISKTDSQQEPPSVEDPLLALSRLQEELFQRNLKYCDIGPEEN